MSEGRLSRVLRAFRLRFEEAPERDMDEEMRFHLEMATRRNIERGLTPDEARRHALATFGGVKQHQETAREALPGHWLDQLRQDFTYAARTLRRNATFTASVVLTLALGVGATTAIFSVVNGVLLRPLPVPDPERFAYVGWAFRSDGFTVLSNFKFDYLRRHNRSFASLTTYRTTERELGHDANARLVTAIRAGQDFFQVIGVHPRLGRGFVAEEYRVGAPAVAVLSDALWRTAFGADRDVIGREMRYGGASYTVVGVLPPGFRVPGLAQRSAELVIPYPLLADPTDHTHNTMALARLRADRTRAQIGTDLMGLAQSFRRQYPDLATDTEQYRLLAFDDIYVGGFKRT